jgi:hypothetical protein
MAGSSETELLSNKSSHGKDCEKTPFFCSSIVASIIPAALA